MKILLEQLGRLMMKSPSSGVSSSIGSFPLGREIHATKKIVVEMPTEYEMLAIHKVKSIIHPVVVTVLYNGSIEISYEDELAGEKFASELVRSNVIFRRSSGI